MHATAAPGNESQTVSQTATSFEHLPGTDAVRWMEPDSLREFMHTLGDGDLPYLAHQLHELDLLVRELNERCGILRNHVLALLEYRNAGAKAKALGNFVGTDGREHRFEAVYEPGPIEREWDQAGLSHTLELLEQAPEEGVRALAAKHFKRELKCKNVRNAGAALLPLGGEIATAFQSSYRESQGAPKLTLKIEPVVVETTAAA